MCRKIMPPTGRKKHVNQECKFIYYLESYQIIELVTWPISLQYYYFILCMADQSQSRILNPASWLVIWKESQSIFFPWKHRKTVLKSSILMTVWIFILSSPTAENSPELKIQILKCTFCCHRFEQNINKTFFKNFCPSR